MVFMVSSLNGASAFGLELFFLGTIFHRWSKGLYWSGKKRGGVVFNFSVKNHRKVLGVTKHS
jgi:hypothetical protein